ncbi:MAG: hypothetical protein ABWY51_00820 [Gaiellaceae bacterium]
MIGRTLRPAAVVSCHVERPLDDECWRRFSRLQERRPNGFAIAALLRPPDAEAGEDAELWLERAQAAAGRGPLGHHTHFVGPSRARPAGGGREHAERVRREALWMRGQGLEPRLFCGGGWYIDEGVVAVLAELGYADCTGTAFVPSYLGEDAPRFSAESPTWLSLPDGRRLLELPSTHSLGMAARAAAGSLPSYLHVYFHDTDLLTRKRRAALAWALAVLGRRCEVTDLETLQEASNALSERTFSLN